MAPGFLDVLVGEDADQDAEGDDGAVGDLHYRCDEGGEAEAFDDYCAEVGDSCAARDVSFLEASGLSMAARCRRMIDV